MTDAGQYATKADVREIVGEVVGEIVSDALGLIAERFEGVDRRFISVDRRFDEIDRRFDKLDAHNSLQDTQIADLQASVTRIENKLNATIDTVNGHTHMIGQLQQKIA